jgi:hypothetical protein
MAHPSVPLDLLPWEDIVASGREGAATRLIENPPDWEPVLRDHDETAEYEPPSSANWRLRLEDIAPLAPTSILERSLGMRTVPRTCIAVWSLCPDGERVIEWAHRQWSLLSLSFDSMFALLGHISVCTKKWPQWFVSRLGVERPATITENKNLAGLSFRPGDFPSKTGKVFDLASEYVALAAGKDVVSPTEEKYETAMGNAIDAALVTMKWQNKYRPMLDFITDSDVWAKQGTDISTSLEREDGETVRVSKRGAPLTTTPEEIHDRCLNAVSQLNKAVYKMDFGAARLIFVGDTFTFITMAWLFSLVGNPVSSAQWTSLGKEGAALLDFFVALHTQASDTLLRKNPADYPKFDTRCRKDTLRTWRTKVWARIRVMVGHRPDVEAAIAALERSFEAIYVQIPNVTADQKSAAQTDMPEGLKVVSAVAKGGGMFTLLFNYIGGLLSGWFDTAGGGSTINFSWDMISATMANWALGSSAIGASAAAGDDVGYAGTTVAAIWALAAVMGKMGISFNQLKSFVSYTDTEFLRVRVSPAKLEQYLCRSVPRIVVRELPKSGVDTPQTEASAYVDVCSSLARRGMPLHIASILLEKGLARVCRFWNVPMAWLKTPAWQGGGGAGTLAYTFKDIYIGTAPVNLRQYKYNPTFAMADTDQKLKAIGITTVNPRVRHQLIEERLHEYAAGIMDPHLARDGREAVRASVAASFTNPPPFYTLPYTAPLREREPPNLLDINNERRWLTTMSSWADTLIGRCPKDFRWTYLTTVWREKRVTSVNKKLDDMARLYSCEQLVAFMRPRMPGGTLIAMLQGDIASTPGLRTTGTLLNWAAHCLVKWWSATMAYAGSLRGTSLSHFSSRCSLSHSSALQMLGSRPKWVPFSLY